MRDVIIIGGGLGGLITALCLAETDWHVTLIEEKKYPFHRVCGEYISSETIPFLKRIDAYPEEIQPPLVKKLQVSSPSGATLEMPLDLGGFGISRHYYDHFLYRKLLNKGIEVLTQTKVEKVTFQEDHFSVFLKSGQELRSKVAIGSFGKRSTIDQALNRPFIKKKAPYLGVKYHIKTEHSNDLIALHNFKDGYCGISKVENETYNLCYLSTRKNVKDFGSISLMEENVLYKNPFLRSIFQNADFLWDRPEVINAFSFAPKPCIENHMLLVGDAAGLITPLCGNGMALAIHAAKIASETIKKHYQPERTFDRIALEKEYSFRWRKQFARRLWVGRKLQSLFGNTFTSELAVQGLNHAKPIASWLVKQTHGEPF